MFINVIFLGEALVVSVGKQCARCLCYDVIFHAMAVADFNAVMVEEFDASGCKF